MKNLVKLIGIIAFVTLIGFAMIGCDDGNGDGGSNSGGTTATFTMEGDYFNIFQPEYHYSFWNNSSYQVKVTINGETKEIIPYDAKTNTVDIARFENISTSSVTVTYTPADKVRYEHYRTGVIFLYDK